jgi:hypothetical protein
MALRRPVSKKDKPMLFEIPYEKLKNKFKYQFKILKDKIYRKQPKTITGRRLNGPLLVQLILELVNSNNNGEIPKIWDNILRRDIKELYEKAIG